MNRKKPPAEVVLDLVVPASFASRYRARLIALTRLDARLRLAFCPSIFRSDVSSCPADLWLVSGDLFAPLRGVVEVRPGSTEVIGQVHFDRPLERRDFDALQRACQPEEATFAENADVGSNPSSDSAERLPGQPEGDLTAPSVALLH